jgi:hypothetical protein
MPRARDVDNTNSSPITRFQRFENRFSHCTPFPESPKADKKIHALQSLKNEIRWGMN